MDQHESGVEAAVNFRDTAFKSRVVLLPDGRTLRIARSHVAVPADDAVALAALRADRSFKEEAQEQ